MGQPRPQDTSGSSERNLMSYPNYGSTTAGFPAPTSGVGVPAVVTISGTGVAQTVTRNADGAGATGGTYGPVVTEQMRGPEYVAPMAKSSTLQLAVTIKDSQGNTVAQTNTVTYRSLNAAPLSQASFRPPTGATWLPNTGNGLNWDSDVATVSGSGLVTANDLGYAIIEVRYPKSSNGDANDFIFALLLVTVTTTGTDVE